MKQLLRIVGTFRSWSLAKCFWAELKSDFSPRFRLQPLLGKFQCRAQTSSICPTPPLIPARKGDRPALHFLSKERHPHLNIPYPLPESSLSGNKEQERTFFYYSATGRHWEKKSSGSNPSKALIRTVFVLRKECRDWREALYLKLQYHILPL